MKKSSYIYTMLLLCFMMVQNTAKAQWHKWHIGGGVGSMTYYGDLSDKFANANLQEFGYHAYVERILAKKSGIYFRLETVNGHLIGSDRAPGGWLNNKSADFARSLNFRTTIHDVNSSFVFYFGNSQKRDKAPFLNAYIRAGIGVGFFDVYGDLKDGNGNFYNYWSDLTIRDLPENDPNASQAQAVSRDYDYETNLREMEMEKSYNKFKWQIPVGLGIKMRLGSLVSLIVDAQYTYSMTDYLDNVGDLPLSSNITNPDVIRSADPTGYIGNQPRSLNSPTGMNDSYFYVSAGLNFNIGDNKKPKFKTPVFYPKMNGYTTDTNSTNREPQSSKIGIDSTLSELDSMSYSNEIKSGTSLQKMKADSIVLTKSSDGNQYLLQYYFNGRIDTVQKGLNNDAETLMKSSDGFVSQAFRADSLWSSEDTVQYMIQQMRLQLDSLERKFVRPETNNLSSSDSNAKFVQDTIIPFGLADTVILPQVQNDTVLKVKTSDTAKDTIIKDSLPDKVQVISDSVMNPLELQADTLSPVQIPLNDSLKTTNAIVASKDSLPSSVISYTDSVVQEPVVTDSLTPKIKQVNETLVVHKDTAKSTVVPNLDTLKIKTSVQLDTSVFDTISTARIPQKETLVLTDTVVRYDSLAIKTLSDSIQKYESQQSELEKQLLELKTELQSVRDSFPVDTLSIAYDKLQRSIADTVAVFEKQNTYLQQKIDSLQKFPLKVTDTVTQKIYRTDTIVDQQKIDTLKSSIEGLKSQIKDLENAAQLQKDSLLLNQNEILQLKKDNNQKDSIQTGLKSSLKEMQIQNEYDLKTDSLNRKLAELETELKKSSKRVDTVVMASPFKSSSAVENTTQDPQTELLQKRIEELEAQIRGLQNVSTRTTPLRDSSYQGVSAQRISTPAVETNIPLTSDYTTPSTSVQPNLAISPTIELSSSGKKNKKNKDSDGVQVGFDYNGKPGFIQARRMRKEDKGTIASSDTIAIDSLADSTQMQLPIDTLSFQDSLNVGWKSLQNNLSSTAMADTTLKIEGEKITTASDSAWIRENQKLKKQLVDIQQSQDSLLNLLQKWMNQPKETLTKTDSVFVEKQVLVPQEVDEATIIQSVLSQPSTKVFFGVGKYAVSNQYKLSLDQLASQLLKYPQLKLRLKGFADPTGNAAANLKLSERRAESVRTYLIQKFNLSPDRFILLPAGQEENSSDMSYSRRVEVQLVK